MQGDLQTLSGKVDNLSGNFDKFRGHINERNFRSIVGEVYGLECARPFNAKGLSGLARLVTVPKKKKGYLPEPLSDIYDISESSLSDVQLLSKSVKTLTTFIFDHRDVVVRHLREQGIPDRVCESIFLDRDKMSVSTVEELKALQTDSKAMCRMLCKYALAKSAERVHQIESDSGVGMLLFSAATGLSPVHELAMDCRPSIRQTAPNQFTATCFEIKSSRSGIQKATDQLSRGLAILTSAIKVVSAGKTKKSRHKDASANGKRNGTVNGNGKTNSNVGGSGAVNGNGNGNGERTPLVTKVGVIVLPEEERDDSKTPPTCDFWLEFLYS
jgi:hypothetical protein